jgi:pyruvate/2-oxoglutarate dehydrogenase complex dihydrolipoamide dehydrogenase (E3) component
MSGIENYDVLVIGSGEAGKYLAWTMAGEGHRTAGVERKLIGESCPNIACLPSKNVIHSAKVRSFTRQAAEFGVELGSAATNMKGVQGRKRRWSTACARCISTAPPDTGSGRRGKIRQRGTCADGGTRRRRRCRGSDLLIAVGRTPNTEGIGLERAGVARTAMGYIRVDERLAPTAAGVWAMGECAGSPQFTHVAFDDFRVVHDNLTGGSRTTRDSLVPYCMYLDPELRGSAATNPRLDAVASDTACSPCPWPLSSGPGPCRSRAGS